MFLLTIGYDLKILSIYLSSLVLLEHSQIYVKLGGEKGKAMYGSMKVFLLTWSVCSSARTAILAVVNTEWNSVHI